MIYYISKIIRNIQIKMFILFFLVNVCAPSEEILLFISFSLSLNLV